MPYKRGQTKPDGSGRQKGQVNSQTKEVQRLAKMHGPDAIKKLAYLMENAEDERAKVAAANSILDRAYGKSSQVLGIDPEQNKINVVIMGDDAKL